METVTQKSNNRLLSPLDLSQFLGVPVRSIYQWVHRGRIKAIPVGRHIRFDPEMVARKFEISKKTLSDFLAASRSQPEGSLKIEEGIEQIGTPNHKGVSND